MATLHRIKAQILILLVLMNPVRLCFGQSSDGVIFTKILVLKDSNINDGALWVGSVLGIKQCHFICLTTPLCVYLEYSRSNQTCTVFNNIHQNQWNGIADADIDQFAVERNTINKRTVPRSCAEVHTCSNSSQDGEYWIYPSMLGGYQRLKVYCHNMQQAPSEYITLHYTNYMVHHDQTNLIDIWAPCSTPSFAPLKTVYFHKIRLDITTMLVDQRDYTFTTIIGNQALLDVGYGETRDCRGEFWRYQCDFQGRVEINTRGTGLIVDPSEIWKADGWESRVYNFQRANDNSKIQVKCSGWCAHCRPTSNTILLQITTETVTFLDAETVVCET